MNSCRYYGSGFRFIYSISFSSGTKRIQKFFNNRRAGCNVDIFCSFQAVVNYGTFKFWETYYISQDLLQNLKIEVEWPLYILQ